MTVHISNSHNIKTMRWVFCRSSQKERMQMAVQGGFVLQLEVFPRLLLITELCPWARCFYPVAPPGQRPSISSGPRSGTASMSPSNARPRLGPAGRAARLGTHLGPGKHIPAGAAERPQLGTAALQRPRPGQGLLPEPQGPQPGWTVIKGVATEGDGSRSVLVFSNITILDTRRQSVCLLQSPLKKELFHTINSFYYTFSITRYCYFKFFSRSYNKTV